MPSKNKLKFSIIVFALAALAAITLFLNRNYFKCIYWRYFKNIYCVDIQDPQLIHFYADSLRIAGDIYKPENPNSSAILLLHGSAPEGRNAPLIKALGSEFANIGYIAMAIDMRAYGESEDPESLTVKNFNFAHDAIAAINYLIRNFNIDTNKVYIVGHSFGAGIAISAAAADSRIKKIVLFGPPRRLEERFFSKNAKDQKYFLKRWQRDMKLPYKLDFNIWDSVYQKLDIENYVTLFNSENHIPIFLIDGQKEDAADKLFLKKIYSQLSQPVKYWTVPNSNHYLNVELKDGRLVHLGQAEELFVNKVNDWLKN